MPIIKSAKKRVKTAAKANLRNTRTRRDMREAIKAFNRALEASKSTEVFKLQRAAVSAIDTAAKKNVIHKNKAARFKSRLASQAKLAGVKPSSELSRLVLAKADTGRATRKSTTGKPSKASPKSPVRQAQGKKVETGKSKAAVKKAPAKKSATKKPK